MPDINILAIESSCDDTGAAVIANGNILANVVATQTIHEKWGGVVPELASRAHMQHIVPVVHEALKIAGIKKNDLSAIAFTAGPGLIGSLLVGATFAKSFALALGIPLISVNHLNAHVMALLIDEPKPSFPFLCLLVSGGHTQLMVVKAPLQFEVIGQTTDDAAGEAFDKTAKILGLAYPGGPLLDKLAQQGDHTIHKFPKPQIPELDFSFSGFKTSVLYYIEKQKKMNPHFVTENLNDLCAAIQYTLVETLAHKVLKAIAQTGITQVAIAGGVAANSGLRKKLQDLSQQKGFSLYIPAFQYCTDNAAMIAITAHYQYLDSDFAEQSLAPYPRAL
ncbi:MAG: tRNA (adenosine(37)-N6)-threonylcarbamoyltransferase complex transferase subunit TsaD [Bacteroidota bacterium]|nr:tRNA (adenosine(37)-N6)-threonylcarbamoyltransferase complex transferase subunit TsaD [Bacteroidota bacterium]